MHTPLDQRTPPNQATLPPPEVTHPKLGGTPLKRVTHPRQGTRLRLVGFLLVPLTLMLLLDLLLEQRDMTGSAPRPDTHPDPASHKQATLNKLVMPLVPLRWLSLMVV